MADVPFLHVCLLSGCSLLGEQPTKANEHHPLRAPPAQKSHLTGSCYVKIVSSKADEHCLQYLCMASSSVWEGCMVLV